jgi:hypothetical protein
MKGPQAASAESYGDDPESLTGRVATLDSYTCFHTPYIRLYLNEQKQDQDAD